MTKVTFRPRRPSGVQAKDPELPDDLIPVPKAGEGGFINGSESKRRDSMNAKPSLKMETMETMETRRLAWIGVAVGAWG